MSQISQGIDHEIPDRMRSGILVVLVVTTLLAISASYFGAQRLLVAQTQSVAEGQHALYLRSLSETIQQHQHLPYILAQNPALAERVAQGDAPSLNETLQDLSDAAGLEALYVMALDGEVIATSNFAETGSFLGQNYGFRPYFQGAIAGRYTDYFAIGATTGRPGYFVAGPLLAETGALIGVIAIKLDFSELQSAWEERGEHVLATNADGVTLVSSNPNWLYRTIAPLEAVRRDEILGSRQFADEPLSSLEWRITTPGRVVIDGNSYFVTSGQTELVNWTVHYLSPASAVNRQILMTTGVLGAIVAALIGFAVFLRSRRISAALAVSQRSRRDLIRTNSELLKTRDELARASKLAALGQLAASVTHELGQPISALKNHLVAAELGNEITSPKTADNLKRLTARMEGITKQLRFFARRSPEEMQLVDIGVVISEAIGLLHHDAKTAGVTLKFESPFQVAEVSGVQLQLEQAMTNLIRNAVQASENSDDARVEINVDTATPSIEITISDTGSGLQGLTLDELKEPFFSTKSSGIGMGLGLSITAEIIREHGGQLSACERPGSGAIFTVTLPKASKEAT